MYVHVLRNLHVLTRMQVQAEKKPELEIPWVVLALVNAILTNKGSQTEGIFRVPGDIDAVNMLKVSSTCVFVCVSNVYVWAHAPYSHTQSPEALV